MNGAGMAIAGAVSAAVFGGMMFAFSNFVIRAFTRVPASEAIRAMQAINRTVINPVFLLLFVGPGLLGVVVTAPAVWAGQVDVGWVLATWFYCVGVIAVTITVNVPLNDALAKLDADRPDAAELWRRYAVRWVRYNHVRSVAAVAAALAFLGAA